MSTDYIQLAITIVNLLVAAGFTVGMLLATAKVKQLQAEQARELANLELRIESRLGQMEERYERKISSVHDRVNMLMQTVSRIEGKLDRNGKENNNAATR